MNCFLKTITNIVQVPSYRRYDKNNTYILPFHHRVQEILKNFNLIHYSL